MDALADRSRREYAEVNRGWGVRLVPLPDEIVGDVRAGLLMLVGAIGMLVVLMSANVASLVLSQNVARSGEIAVRMSLGASHARIVRQLLTETVLLCVAGGAAGCALSFAGVALVKRFGPPSIPRLSEVTVDWRVTLVAFAVAAAMGVLVGLQPAWRAFHHDVAEGMRGGRTSTRRSSLRDTLVLVEVAVSVTLLIGAGLLVRSLMNLERVDPGFSPRRVLTARLAVPPGKYSDATGEKLVLFWSGLLDRIEAIPGVERAALTSELPLGGLNNPSPRTGAAPGGQPFATDLRSVSPGYADAMRIPLRSGRFFTSADGKQGQRVVVINEKFARDVFGTAVPLGQTITFNFRDRADTSDYQAAVIGVIGSIRHASLASTPSREAFLPYSQSPLNSYSIAARTRADDPSAVVRPLRDVVSSIDPMQSIGQIQTLDNIVSSGLAQPKFRGYLLAGFASFALLLAVGGLYGLLALMVAQQSKEIGVRVAVGASSWDVVALVLRASLRPTIGGVVMGLMAGASLVSTLRTLIFGVGVWDPTSFVVAPMVLLIAAVGASYIPARRAAAVDPVVALRAD